MRGWLFRKGFSGIPRWVRYTGDRRTMGGMNEIDGREEG